MNNMGKRLYVSPKSTAIEMEPLSMLSASLGFSDETTDTSGRARDYNESGINENNSTDRTSNSISDQVWSGK